MGNFIRRIIFIITCVTISLISTYFGQPLLNNGAIIILITVMTVFAGFLVAIVAILGDPAMLPGGSWRAAESRREKLFNSITTHTWIFRLYLLSIALLFWGALMEKAPDGLTVRAVKPWIERLYLFFGIFSFCLTLALPGMLAKLQLARVDAEISRRRKEAGFAD